MPDEISKIYNILLMGVTGTGKSTFINSIANYFMFETLEEAIESEPKCVIPTKFNLTFFDANEEQKDISIEMKGIDVLDKKNERFDSGQSCTVQPRVYCCESNGIAYNIIDVPGIADTGGIQQDKINKQAIINQIGRFKEIHGICIMVKENINKLTNEFVFAINEILGCFSKSAINNILFLVTHSQSAQFTSGQVSVPLKQYIKNLNAERKINLEFDKNVFCIDNESFRFQVGWHQSKEFRELQKMELERYKISWKRSRAAVFKLFKRMYEMNAHRVEDTMGVARANIIVQCIIRPLTTVMGLIAEGSSPEYKQQVINSLMGTGTLNKPDVEPEKVRSPQMICTHKDCIKSRIDQKTGKKVFDFSNACHKDCILKDVISISPGNPALRECQFFDTEGTCRKCKHSYKFHMHVPFQVIQTMSQVESGRKLNREEAEKRYDEFYKKLISEKTTIMKNMIMLSDFLRENVIIEYNNAFKDRIEVEIKTAEIMGNKNAVLKLRETLKDYEDRLKIINAVKNTKAGDIKVQQVAGILEELFSLQLYGKTIKSLLNNELPPSEAANARDFIRFNANYIPV